MLETDAISQPRLGRPPKVDEHGTPTRDRLLRAAVDACVEFGYDGVTLAEIARRAGVSTPAVYSHFPGKAALLVEASKHELEKLDTGLLPGTAGLREVAHFWLRPDFSDTRILLIELHAAANRQREVAELLRDWQTTNAEKLRVRGLTTPQITMFYLLLMGIGHLDTIDALSVDSDAMRHEIDDLIDGWIGDDGL
ncbi:MAG: helix-turn-helix domain-containing protein [Acidimicrobiia bacterium]|nr:helix-turn-helix domain-containing protein [Acidimicrobiia bacterium]